MQTARREKPMLAKDVVARNIRSGLQTAHRVPLKLKKPQNGRVLDEPWATVFDNGVWHTWDDDGVGGENSREENNSTSISKAIVAALKQGFIKTRYQVGDVVWVRECWAHYQTVNHVRRASGTSFSEVSDGLAGYRADGHDTIEDFRKHVRLMSECDLESIEIKGDRWQPSIHMPRWAARTFIEITEAKIERLHEITEEECLAEGIKSFTKDGQLKRYWPCDPVEDDPPKALRCKWKEMPLSPINAFHALWDSCYGKTEYRWSTNPWVEAYKFNLTTVPHE